MAVENTNLNPEIDVLLIKGLSLEIKTAGAGRLKKTAVTINPLDGCDGCNGGSPIPKKCPLSGQSLKNNSLNMIVTPLDEIDEQLKDATCTRIDNNLVNVAVASSRQVNLSAREIVMETVNK